MSDTKDVIQDARIRIKKIAASMLARKEGLEKERARLDKERTRIAQQIEAFSASEDTALKAQLDEGLSDLDQRIAMKDEEIATAEKDQQDAMNELSELARLAKDADRAELRAIVDSAQPAALDDRSAEDIALENVRTHIENLEARADLDAELSKRTAKSERAVNKAIAEADAKRELEALKAKRKSAPTEKAPAEPKTAEGDDSPSGIVGPKRTL
jgi:hypothetical protein